jgi:hypothetical protein
MSSEGARALALSAARVPAEGSVEGFTTFLQALSGDLVAADHALTAAEAIELLSHKAVVLGLDESRLDDHVRRGLLQEGAMAPEEDAEYRRNLARLFAQAPIGDPAQPTPQHLFEAFVRLGRELADHLQSALVPCESTRAVFLGTDAEFLKTVYDVLAGSACASLVFYVSRASLLGEEEHQTLIRTSRAVFGEGLTTRRVAGGFPTHRDYSWMDNGIVSSQLYHLITVAHERVRQARGRTFEDVYVPMFADELRDGPLQAQRAARGWLTFFGEPHPEVDRLILTSIEEGTFAARCTSIAESFRQEILAREPRITLVELGATGSQACLLFGAVENLHSSGAASERGRLSVLLFTPDPARWGRPGSRFRVSGASPMLALAIETLKTFGSAFDAGSEGRSAPRVVAPEQQLVAYLKHVAFHRAALDVRDRYRLSS